MFKVSKSKETWEEKYHIFKETDLRKIGTDKGLTIHESKIFAKFMGIRFPKERDSLYVQEWAGRFKTGHPENYMDSESLEAYKKARGF